MSKFVVITTLVHGHQRLRGIRQACSVDECARTLTHCTPRYIGELALASSSSSKRSTSLFCKWPRWRAERVALASSSSSKRSASLFCKWPRWRAKRQKRNFQALGTRSLEPSALLGPECFEPRTSKKLAS